MVFKNCNETIPLKPNKFNQEDLTLINSIKNSLNDYRNLIDEQKFDEYLKSIWIVISNANKYVDEQAPWALKKNNFERMEVVLFTLVETIRQISILLQPFIPVTAEKILDHMKIPDDQRKLKSLDFILNGNIKISLPNPLFPRI